MNVQDALNEATQQLAADSSSPQLDASILLCHLLQVDRLTLLLNHEQSLSSTQLAQFNALIEKRSQGMPVAYLTGVKGFWSLELSVNQHTLVPRPETELLVETALNLYPSQEKIAVADLGTGSGAIALALAVERPQWNITAIDVCEQALLMAQQNAKTHAIKNVTFCKSHWFAELEANQFHMIVSNPPYLAETDPHLDTNIKHEPRSALVSGPHGLESLMHIIEAAQRHLVPGGWLVLEHGYQQAEAVQTIFAAQSYQAIQSLRDLSGHFRVTYAQFS